MWLCMCVCMVYTEHTKTAAVSCGTSCASAISISTPFRWILKKRAIKTIHSCRVTCERSESAQEQRIALYKRSSSSFVSISCSYRVTPWKNVQLENATRVTSILEVATAVNSMESESVHVSANVLNSVYEVISHFR